ncbi:hypothetical protein AB0399_26675 [Streptomyces sp. NPDC088194]|uniref:hypothetical protein n=1 Tax=Streptomyces sp. NPDC088194 TaxID=3154931 RepID=UPI00344F0D5F
MWTLGWCVFTERIRVRQHPGHEFFNLVLPKVVGGWFMLCSFGGMAIMVYGALKHL